jgi:hypothetical protein
LGRQIEVWQRDIVIPDPEPVDVGSHMVVVYWLQRHLLVPLVLKRSPLLVLHNGWYPERIKGNLAVGPDAGLLIYARHKVVQVVERRYRFNIS